MSNLDIGGIIDQFRNVLQIVGNSDTDRAKRIADEIDKLPITQRIDREMQFGDILNSLELICGEIAKRNVSAHTKK